MPDINRVMDLMDEDFKSDARMGVVKGLDGDKKKAADSLAIEKDTTADAQRVYGDYDNFNRRRKSELGQTLVEDDKWLEEYVRSHPLNGAVSKDDWGKLSTFTGAAKELLPTESSYFMRGLVSSLTKENPELVAEFMEGMSYHMPESLQSTMMRGSKAVKDFSLGITPGGYDRKTGSMFDVGSIGDAWAWGMETLGSGFGSMIPSLALGGAGAGAGFAVGGPAGAFVGGMAGAGGVSYAMGYGEVYKALKDEGIDPKTAATLAGAAAVPIAALDLASLEFLVSRFGSAQAVKKELTRAVARKLAAQTLAKGATVEGITEGLQEVIKDATVSLAADKDFATKEHLKGWVENAVGGAMVGGVASGPAGLRIVRKTADKTVKTIENGQPWVAAGQSPPFGVDPVIDHIIGLQSEQRMEIFDAIMENAEKTETKELSPEAWQNLTNIVFSNQHIELRWDAVKALYGDKAPEADDKMLGFVPDIAKQFENSNNTGESIKVKLADWVGRVDPEINKLFHDDIAFPDGITINEAKEQPTLSEASKTTEIPETAFPPLAQELDKPYSLSKGKEGLYDILDEQGDKAASVSVTETEGGKNLHVHWETGQIDVAGLRTLMNQLKQEYPNAETITSPKVPGVEALRRDLQGSEISVDLPFRIKESTVDIVRRSAGLEPLFDLPREGPRAIRLVRTSPPTARREASFQITDELGKPIGEMELTLRRGGKELHVDWIGNFLDQREMGTDLLNKLGPKLIRNLFRELKTNFPNAEILSGDRISGARGATGKFAEGDIQINLAKLQEEAQNAPPGWEGVEGGAAQSETQKLIDLTQGWTKFGKDLIAQRQREWTPEELALEKKISDMMDKLVGREPRVYGAEDIRLGKTQRKILGVMQPYHDRRPLILWSLSSPDPSLAHDPVGTARHEAVHFLRRYGYITEPEWETLKKHVLDNDLIKKHGIDVRYWYADEELQIEEAICEEFRTWARAPEAEHWSGKVFQRIKEILDNIRSAYREYLGREPTVDDIMGDIERGRVARRTPGEGPLKGLHRIVDTRAMEIDPYQDAGFTESEIKRGISEGDKQKVAEGYIFWGGSLTKATPELLEQFQKEAAKDAELYAKGKATLDERFAKEEHPQVRDILGSDWGGADVQAIGYKQAAYRHLEVKYRFNRMMVGKIERAIERGKVPEYQVGGPVEPEGVPTFEPGALMDKARYAKYQRHINQRNHEDTIKERDDAAREIQRREKPEWKQQTKEMAAEVARELTNRPDWKVSQFFRNGMFFGMDSKYRPKIDPKYLTPEQRKGLPRQFQTKGGMDPDALAGSFGYSSGEVMVDKMIDFERAKGELGPKEFFEKSVKEEADRRMELKHGKLSENILKEAMDHVIGTTQMDLLHEEVVAIAMRAGQGIPLSKEDLRKNAARRFHDETASGVSMRGYFREMYRAGKSAELAFLNGDWVEAFKQKQAQVNLFALAEHAKKFEKVQEKVNSIIKEFNKRDHDVTKIPPEFVEWIHTILFQIKRPPKRLPEDLARMIAIRPHRTLSEFADYYNILPEGAEEFEGDMNPNMPIWDQLMEVDQNGIPTWTKDFKDLTVGEVKAINDSMQALKKIGRDEGKYIARGETHVLANLLGNMENQLSKLGIKKEAIKGTALGEVQSALQWMKGGLIQLEAMFDRWDKGNQRGIFTKMFSAPLTEASNTLSTMQRGVARMIKDADKQFGLKKSQLKKAVENDVFYDPRFLERDPNNPGKWVIPQNGENWLRLTKEHVRGIILNWGNPSNRKRLAEGYYTTEAKIQAWLDKVADKRDWDWASKIWKIYEHIQKDSDEMTFRMSGTLVEMLPLPKFQTKFGEYEGGYYPIIYDKTKGGGPRLKAEPPPPTVARTYTGWERKRSGSAGPLDLSLTEMGNFMSRRLKDNAFREPLHNIHKIWFNKEFEKNVSKYYGDYAVKMLHNAYNDFAGRTGLTSGASQAGNQFAELIRQNTIGALIAFNPGTVMKHGPSALFQSWGQAGIFKPDFYKATLAMANPITAVRNYNFMMKGDKVGSLDWEGSGELQRRHQHWAETIGGAGDIQLRKMTFRESFLYYGSYPVAWSDMISSTILWKAKYDKTMAELQQMPIEEAHTEAVRLADYAIRMTHGSTAITSRPEFMRSTNSMTRYLTSLYGFFNHVFNRFYRMSWKAKDLVQDKWRGDISNKELAKGFGELTGDFMMYIVLPAAVEAMVVEGLMSADWDDMDWGDLIGKGMIHTVGASVPIVREAVHAMSSGHDPTAGLIGTATKGYTDLFRQANPNKEVWDVGKIIQNFSTAAGISTGVGGTQLGRWGKFIYNYSEGEEAPEGGADWYRAFRSGTTVPRRHQ